MHGRYRPLGVAFVALMVLLAGDRPALTRTRQAPPPFRRILPGPSFAASGQFVDDGAVNLYSATTGQLERTVVPGRRGRLQVSAIAALPPGRLLVTYSTGPDCSGPLAGCGPRPHTCGAEVDQVDVASVAVIPLWREGEDVWLAAAVPSPDGREVAALTAPCVPYYFNSHLVVRRLADGRTWTMGGGLPRCHDVSGPAWTNEGQSLLVSYAPAVGRTPYTGPDGTCTGAGDSMLLELDAHSSQPGLRGRALRPPPACTYQSVAGAGAFAYVVRACGPYPNRLDGPTTLVRLDPQLRPTRSWPLGKCTDGNDVAVNWRGQLLVSAYLYCGRSPGPSEIPITVLDRLDGDRLTHVTTVQTSAFNAVAW